MLDRSPAVQTSRSAESRPALRDKSASPSLPRRPAGREAGDTAGRKAGVTEGGEGPRSRTGFLAEIRGAVMATVMLAVVCCGLYPLLVFGIGQALFHDKANGSLIVDSGGTVRGSRLLGQPFTADKYFHSRPSAAGNGYDATSSGGSNLGPTSQKLNDAIKDRIAAYRAENGLKATDPVPADAVTASGSGLDPHISVRNALLQAPRVAKARNLGVDKVLELVRQNTERPDLGILGEPRVNVLKSNLALDRLSP